MYSDASTVLFLSLLFDRNFVFLNRRLLKTLGSCDAELRCKVALRYKELYKIDLKQLMIQERGNTDFGIALQFLSVDPVHAECDMIFKSCKGAGTDERLLFSILCGRSNQEIEILKVIIRQKFFSLFENMRGKTEQIMSLSFVFFILDSNNFTHNKFAHFASFIFLFLYCFFFHWRKLNKTNN